MIFFSFFFLCLCFCCVAFFRNFFFNARARRESYHALCGRQKRRGRRGGVTCSPYSQIGSPISCNSSTLHCERVWSARVTDHVNGSCSNPTPKCAVRVGVSPPCFRVSVLSRETRSAELS